MVKINYHTTTNIWLCLEEYYNIGITDEEVKDIIEKIKDPYSGMNFYCRSMGFNGNWIIDTTAKNPYSIEDIVYEIESKIKQYITSKKTKNKKIPS